MNDSPYIYNFDPQGDSTAACAVRFVGPRKHVLELGCAYGVMTKVLVEHNGCRVFGIEYDEASAKHALPYCEELRILNIEDQNWEDIFGEKRFDVILAADVLEHLRDPQKCLISLRNYLKPDGYFVLSVPNIAYSGIVAELLNEDFCYRKTGLLDSTHLRFWGVKGLERLLRESGYVIDSLEMTTSDPELSEFAESWSALPPPIASALRSRPLGDVYQYVVKAYPSESTAATEIPLSIRPWIVPFEDFERRAIDAEERIVSAEAAIEIIKAREAQLETLNQQMIQSSSWQLTRPLRVAARFIRYGFTDQDRLHILLLLKNRYHSLPLPAPAKSLIRFAYHRLFCKAIRFLRDCLTSQAKFQAPSTKPNLKQQDKPDYIIWGVVDWHFRHQRPQQLALALVATGRRVFYISPTLVDDKRGGFEAEALDASGQLFQVKLFAEGGASIYSDAPSLAVVNQLRRSIGEALNWAVGNQSVSLVDHPFWLDVAAVLPHSRLVYDCMDHHEGFGNNAESLLELEKRLLNEAELTVTTSTWLGDAIAPHAKRRALIRNAGDYRHFSQVPDSIYSDPHGRRVIGYFGAIAEWFDLNLVEAVAKQHPDCALLLIGADTVNARSRLAKLPNVIFTGEVPYGRLPHYLYGFDVCLLPFKVIPLTLATNPVKAYEYLGAGKPIVAVDLPEMAQFEGLIYAVAGKEAFLAEVSKVLNQAESDSLVQQRKAFAQGQTWQHRAEALIKLAESSAHDPKVSIVVVTYNNIDFTRACLASLDAHSQYEHMEIIVVDNASSDGSPDFLSEWVCNAQNRKLILNEDNRGFAAANNQGLHIASGEYLVLLNNDTYVTPGWLRTLVRHLQRDKSIGLIGPVTNNIGNEARIDIAYADMDEMLLKSAAYTNRHIGQTYPLRTAAFFCVMMTRTTFSSVGALDEIFGRGFFEDDDYCRRVEQVGLRIACAEDVFIHHHLSASFNKLKQQDRQQLFEDNKKLYEAKWGEWVLHGYRGMKPGKST